MPVAGGFVHLSLTPSPLNLSPRGGNSAKWRADCRGGPCRLALSVRGEGKPLHDGRDDRETPYVRDDLRVYCCGQFFPFFSTGEASALCKKPCRYFAMTRDELYGNFYRSSSVDKKLKLVRR